MHAQIHGSALAMLRPMFEAYVRGRWLLYAAADAAVDDAGRDKFPRDFGLLLRDLQTVDTALGPFLAKMKEANWSALCSFTHTGYLQIGARLTPAGLGYDHPERDLVQALGWADFVATLVVGDFANLAGQAAIVSEANRRLEESAR